MKILVGYDYSTVTQDVLALAKQQAQAFKAEVHLLRSLERNPELQHELRRDTIQQAEQNLDQVKREFVNMGLACDTHVVVGRLSAGENIVQFAEQNSIDLIVIGVRRRSKVGKLLFGSNAQLIILTAPCPVLTVK
ncbi:MAG: universal stress protein [Desulfobacterales bacterium]|jgi:nucleotide-binding universal stress UspA family protein